MKPSEIITILESSPLFLQRSIRFSKFDVLYTRLDLDLVEYEIKYHNSCRTTLVRTSFANLAQSLAELSA